MRRFNIILQVDLEDDEIPVEGPDKWREWGRIAKDEIVHGEVYDVSEVH